MLPLKYKQLDLQAPCELLCPGCARWRTNAAAELAQLQRQAQTAKIIHLTGGNPLAYPELGQLLIQLKKDRRFTALTTCGYRLESLEPQLLLLLDWIFLYIPACAKEHSINKTGLNAWTRQESCLEHLQELRKKFAVLYPVDRDTLEDLPDMYNKLLKKNSYLILLHNKKSETRLSRQQKVYLQYYGRRRNVLVYEYKRDAPPSCQEFAEQLAKLSLYNLSSALKLFCKFIFLG